ncbi:MAG TPA: hypothetical protein VMX15_02910 [Candidatus Heimdallarchaeota archaeon]|nr:hypothetical protein [Candidatus Heimdallarchaeota archaeon]
MPFKREVSTVSKRENGQWVVVKKHPNELEAQKQLRELREAEKEEGE